MLWAAFGHHNQYLQHANGMYSSITKEWRSLNINEGRIFRPWKKTNSDVLPLIIIDPTSVYLTHYPNNLTNDATEHY